MGRLLFACFGYGYGCILLAFHFGAAHGVGLEITPIRSVLASNFVKNFSTGVHNITTQGADLVPSPFKNPFNQVLSTAEGAWRSVKETVVNLNPEQSVKFYLYEDPSDLQNYKEIIVGQPDSLRSVKISNNTTFNILIHGFMQDFNSSFPQELKDTYLLHTGEPVVCVDWGHMAAGKFGPQPARALLYSFVVNNVATVGKYVGEFVSFLNDHNVVDLKRVHILGFSLGAHVSGIAGCTVQNITDGQKVDRITGLDPAGPRFFLKTKERRLNQNDANFVDVIHTSQLGYFLQMGHLDFFRNKS